MLRQKQNTSWSEDVTSITKRQTSAPFPDYKIRAANGRPLILHGARCIRKPAAVAIPTGRSSSPPAGQCTSTWRQPTSLNMATTRSKRWQCIWGRFRNGGTGGAAFSCGRDMWIPAGAVGSENNRELRFGAGGQMHFAGDMDPSTTTQLRGLPSNS